MASSSAATAAAAPASGLPVLTLPQPCTIRELQQHFAARRQAAPANEAVQSVDNKQSGDHRPPQILLQHWAIVASFLPPRDAVRLTKLSSALYLAQEALRPLQHCTLKLSRDCVQLSYQPPGSPPFVGEVSMLRGPDVRHGTVLTGLKPLWWQHLAAAAADSEGLRAVYRRLALLSGVRRLEVEVCGQTYVPQPHVFANPGAVYDPRAPFANSDTLLSNIQAALLANLCNVTHLELRSRWDQYVFEDEVLQTMALAQELVRRNQHTLEDMQIYIDDGSDGGGLVIGDTRPAQLFLLQDVSLPRVQTVHIRTPFQSGLKNVQWPRVQSLTLEGFSVTAGGVYECEHTRRCVESTRANQGGDSGVPGVVLVGGVTSDVTRWGTDISQLCALVSALSTGAGTVAVKTDSSRVSTVSRQKAIVKFGGARAFTLDSGEDLPVLLDNGDTRQLPGDVQRFVHLLGTTLAHAVINEVRCNVGFMWQEQNESCRIYQRLVLSALGNALQSAFLSNPLLLPDATHSPATASPQGLYTFVVSLEGARQGDPQQELTGEEVESSALGQVLAGGGLTYTGCYTETNPHDYTFEGTQTKHTFVRLPRSCAHHVAFVSKQLKSRVPHAHWSWSVDPEHTAFAIVQEAATDTLQGGSGKAGWSEQQAVAFTTQVMLRVDAYVAHAEEQQRARQQQQTQQQMPMWQTVQQSQQLQGP